MVLLKVKSGYFKSVPLYRFLVLVLILVFPLLPGFTSAQPVRLSNQETSGQQTLRLPDASAPLNKDYQKKGAVKGRLIQSGTDTPVCFADISCSDKTTFAKTNTNGEFAFYPHEFPTTLRIRKFGFKEETLIINSPNDSARISLAPLEIHKSKPGKKNQLDYVRIFNKALEKLRVTDNTESHDKSQRKLIYCSITSSVDSNLNELFESYSHMKVHNNGLQDYQPDISRYASQNEPVPGLSENRLEFKIDPFINLPIFAGQYFSHRGFFAQDGNQIAVITVDLGETKNTYFINVADTAVVYISGRFKSEKKIRIQGSRQIWLKDRTFSTDISFSRSLANNNIYFVDCINTKEEYRLIQKNNPDQIINKNTLFAIVPDSSIIGDAVRNQVSSETLTGMNRQINFKSKYLLSGKSTAFNSEVEKLLLKPYAQDFWAQNSFRKHDFNEQKQILNWEKDNRFYSENHVSSENELIGADSLVKVMNNNLVAVENVYVETDRPDYLAGDTIWFSAFVLDNLRMDSASLSKILYVDLINADNKIENHLKLFISDGRAKGDFALDKNLKDGLCRLRAYTQYMRNFQGDYLFEKEIPVHRSTFSNLIIVNPVINKSTLGDSIDLYIHTVLPDELKSQDKTLDVFVKLTDSLSVKKTFNFKKNLKGSMGFFVPSSLSCSFADIRLTLSDKTVISEQRLSLPLKSGINLQLFPESGKMVNGINTIIAFKATDNKGEPVEFNADITDENQKVITSITGNKTGMGKFELTPESGHSYKASLIFSGSKYVFNLPVTEPKGYVLNFDSDSSDITIKSNIAGDKSSHYLLISERGAVYASIETKPGNSILRIHLPLEMYPKGILQITLFDNYFRPLAERLVFNNRPDQKMLIHVETDKKEYRKREKVNLAINVTDAAGNPVGSSLSLAVTDASKTDTTINYPDIESYLYLSSELKGEIDYRLLNLSDTTFYGKRNIDLVMMTQGWRNFLWNSIRYANTLKVIYPVEKGFCIQGALSDINNRQPGGGYNISYLDFKSGISGVTKIDDDSKFNIELPFFYKTHDYFIQSRNIKGRIENIGFTLDTFPLPEISYRNNELPYPSYKTAFLGALDEKFTEPDSAYDSPFKTINLAEVKITAKADRTGYSSPDAEIDLNKKDPTGKKYNSLFQMIYEEFGEKAFTATGFGTHGKSYTPILVVNGSPLTESLCPPCYDSYAYNRAASIPVNEISDVKLYEAESNYSQLLTPPPPPPKMKKGLYLAPADPQIYLAVVSIKTYSNSYRGNPKGALIFPYQGFYQAREFYKPVYKSNDTGTPDNRTTIYWNPEVKTDSTGNVRVSFYNSDLKGEALIRISGVSFPLKNASATVSRYLSH